MLKKNTQLLFLFISFFTLTLNAQNTDVMIQGFNWESHANPAGWYNVIKDKATDLGDAQINLIWFPPASDAAAPQGYLPRELNNLNSEYGTQAELVAAINDLHDQNIKVVADIVINHRVGTTNWADFTNPTWGCWAVTSNDEWGQNGGNPCGNYDTGDNYGPARDLDHTNTDVQNGLINWMNFLKNDIGFDGWRYDYVRGYNGYYNSVYNNATSPYFSVGELWDNLDINNADAHRQQLMNWIDDAQGTSNIFDFTTKGILQQAVNGELWRLSNNGGAPGAIGWWPEKSVTFIDNHDTGSTQAHWPFPGDKVMQGYAYILTHPGIPTVFWDHFYDWGLHDEIKDLISVRKDNEIHSGSSLDIKAAQWDLYAAEIDGKVAMKIGPAAWSPSGTGWVLKASGSDYAVWAKEDTPPVDLTIHFKKPSNWGTASIYYWNLTPGGTPNSWPGSTMQAEGNGWYVFTISGADCANLIFSDNGANQSVDLYRCGEGWYDGTWHNSEPGGGGEDLTVHFRPAGYSNPSIYFWEVDNGATTSWPGEAMQNDGDGWYSYTFTGADCANFIFSNNGADQTEDLYSCEEYWLEDPDFRITNTTDIDLQANDWAIFPNPVRQELNLTMNLTQEDQVLIKIHDVSGRMVTNLLSGQYTSGEHQFNFSTDLKNGYYFIQLQVGEQSETKPLMILRK